MHIVAAFKAKTHFSSVITKHGRPAARLTPIAETDRERVKRTIQRFKKLSQSHTLAGLDWKELRRDAFNY
jgi:prevent-host-death family protein